MKCPKCSQPMIISDETYHQILWKCKTCPFLKVEDKIVEELQWDV